MADCGSTSGGKWENAFFRVCCVHGYHIHVYGELWLERSWNAFRTQSQLTTDKYAMAVL